MNDKEREARRRERSERICNLLVNIIFVMMLSIAGLAVVYYILQVRLQFMEQL